MSRAFKRPAKNLWWVVVVVVVVVVAATPNYLRLASPDRGKYNNIWLEAAQASPVHSFSEGSVPGPRATFS